MPTARPRHSLTEDDALAVAFEDAGRRWPEEAAGIRLLRLAEAGGRTAQEDEKARDEAWQRTVRETAGSATGLFAPGYLEELRRDWPD